MKWHKMSSPEFHDKIDAFDLVITALKDHEKRLDALSERLENLVSTLDRASMSTRTPSSEAAISQGHLMVECSQWDEFRDSCQNAAIITFGIENSAFNIYAQVDKTIFYYFEPLPKNKLKVQENKSSFSISKSQFSHIELLRFLVDGKLQCGITLVIHNSMKQIAEGQYLFDLRYQIDADSVKSFLAEELNSPLEKIVEGKIISEK